MSQTQRPLTEWAHDLRSPLTGIEGFARLITGSDDLESVHRWAAKIIDASHRLEGVVADMAASEPGFKTGTGATGETAGDGQADAIIDIADGSKDD